MNTKTYIYSLLFIFFASTLVAQNCLPSGVLFSTQEAIDNFHIDHPNCTTIEGDITITGPAIQNLDSLKYVQQTLSDLIIDDCDNLTSLSGLQNLTLIGGALRIENNANLAVLDGLNSLQSVLGTFALKVNNSLTSISALSNLSSIGYNLEVISNPNLLSLEGLEGITTVHYGLWIGNNGLLTNLNGLNNITAIYGPLILNANYALANIDALSQNTIIGDSLDIRFSPNLTSLNGLQNTESIDKKIVIEDTGISDLSGLELISIVHDSFIIENNHQLTSLDGLDNLTSVAYLEIAYNPVLASLQGLANITSFSGAINILFNSITDLKGLDNLDIVHGFLAISYNDSLRTFDGLDNLHKIEGLFAFRDDSLLNDITALMNLDSVGGFVYIANNDSLTTLSGLDNMYYIGSSSINIIHNHALSVCGVPSICYHITYGNFTTGTHIMDNAPGCNNDGEIENSCNGPVIQGFVYQDSNNNCEIDGDETPLPNWPIIAFTSTDTFIDYTDSEGFYKIFTPEAGSYQVQAIPPTNWNLSCTPVSSVILDNDLDVATVHFFAEAAYPECPTMSVDISSTSMTPCTSSFFKVHYCNIGTQDAVAPKVVVNFSDAIAVTSSSLDYTLIGNNTYEFDIDDAPVGNCGDFYVTANISCDAIDLQAICAYANITPDSICTPDNPSWSKASILLSSQCDVDSVRLKVTNSGEGIMNIAQQVDIIIDDWIVYNTSIQLPPGQALDFVYPSNGKTHIIRAEQAPFHPGRSHPLVTLEGCGTNDIGSFTTGSVLQYPEDDANPFISTDCQEIELIEKAQHNYPRGYGVQQYILPNKDIEYKTEFQNNDSDTLINLVIKEVISPYLDITTLQMGASSHRYSMKIINDTLILHFNKAFIPDEASSSLYSKGFVKYRISQKDDLAPGTVIYNKALIYYGQSPVVETNIVFNTIEEGFVLVDITSPSDFIQLQASPNPFLTETTFHINGLHYNEAQFLLYDQTGRLVREESFSGSTFTLQKGNLQQGVYTFQMIFDQNTKAMGRLTVF